MPKRKSPTKYVWVRAEGGTEKLPNFDPEILQDTTAKDGLIVKGKLSLSNGRNIYVKRIRYSSFKHAESKFWVFKDTDIQLSFSVEPNALGDKSYNLAEEVIEGNVFLNDGRIVRIERISSAQLKGRKSCWVIEGTIICLRDGFDISRLQGDIKKDRLGRPMSGTIKMAGLSTKVERVTQSYLKHIRSLLFVVKGADFVVNTVDVNNIASNNLNVAVGTFVHPVVGCVDVESITKYTLNDRKPYWVVKDTDLILESGVDTSRLKGDIEKDNLGRPVSGTIEYYGFSIDVERIPKSSLKLRRSLVFVVRGTDCKVDINDLKSIDRSKDGVITGGKYFRPGIGNLDVDLITSRALEGRKTFLVIKGTESKLNSTIDISILSGNIKYDILGRPISGTINIAGKLIEVERVTLNALRIRKDYSYVIKNTDYEVNPNDLSDKEYNSSGNVVGGKYLYPGIGLLSVEMINHNTLGKRKRIWVLKDTEIKLKDGFDVSRLKGRIYYDFLGRPTTGTIILDGKCAEVELITSRTLERRKSFTFVVKGTDFKVNLSDLESIEYDQYGRALKGKYLHSGTSILEVERIKFDMLRKRRSCWVIKDTCIEIKGKFDISRLQKDIKYDVLGRPEAGLIVIEGRPTYVECIKIQSLKSRERRLKKSRLEGSSHSSETSISSLRVASTSSSLPDTSASQFPRFNLS